MVRSGWAPFTPYTLTAGTQSEAWAHTGTRTLSKPAWAVYGLLERLWCPGSVSPGALTAL